MLRVLKQNTIEYVRMIQKIKYIWYVITDVDSTISVHILILFAVIIVTIQCRLLEVASIDQLLDSINRLKRGFQPYARNQSCTILDSTRGSSRVQMV